MSYTLLSERTRVARKPHRCIWCWQAIKVGESYVEWMPGQEQPATNGGFA